MKIWLRREGRGGLGHKGDLGWCGGINPEAWSAGSHFVHGERGGVGERGSAARPPGAGGDFGAVASLISLPLEFSLFRGEAWPRRA